MARQIIAVGSAGNDGTGDTLRSGAIKMNANFEELYQDVANLGVLVSDSAGGLNLEGISFDQRSVVFIGADSPNSTPADNNETYLRAIEPTKDNIISLPDSSGTVALLSDIAINPNVLDSQDILNFITTGIDSAAAIKLIEQNSIDSVGVINMVDAQYIGNRVNLGLDSYYAAARIDEYVTKSYLVSNNLVLDSALVLQIIDSQLGEYLDSVDFNNLIGAVETSIIPNSTGSRALGTNTLRFNNLFLSNKIELDSALFQYSAASNRLDIRNVRTLRLVDDANTDSGFIRFGATGAIQTMTVSGSLLPRADTELDLGSSSLRWKDLYLSGNTIYIGDSATIQKGSGLNDNGGLRLNLAMYLDADLPTDGKAGDLLIILDGDSATGGPVLAFKDSDNGLYVKFNSAQSQGGGGF
jgi:hypothetical protein